MTTGGYGFTATSSIALYFIVSHQDDFLCSKFILTITSMLSHSFLSDNLFCYKGTTYHYRPTNF